MNKRNRPRPLHADRKGRQRPARFACEPQNFLKDLSKAHGPSWRETESRPAQSGRQPVPSFDWALGTERSPRIVAEADVPATDVPTSVPARLHLSISLRAALITEPRGLVSRPPPHKSS